MLTIVLLLLLSLVHSHGSNAKDRLDQCWTKSPPGYHRLVHATSDASHSLLSFRLGMGWKPVDPKCQLDDLLSNQAIEERIMRKHRMEGLKRGARGGVLFFGDSIDSYNMFELCEQLNTTKEHWSPGDKDGDGKYNHAYDSLNFCMTPSGLFVGNYFMCGVSFSGPYWQQQTLTPFERIEWSLKNWTQGGPWPHHSDEGRNKTMAPPWLIIFSSNLWDLAGAHDRKEGFLPNKVLSDTFLDSLVDNYTKIVIKMKEVYPKSTLVWKTTALPAHSKSMNDAHMIGDAPATVFFHSIAAVKQVNAAGRAVAKRHGLLILDAEEMASWLTPHMYLRDASHPNKRFALDVGNLMLNMLQDVLDAKSLIDE